MDRRRQQKSLLDWLVLNTEKTIRGLINDVFYETIAACCIDTLNWFATNIRLEYPNLSGQSINNIVWNIIREERTKPTFLSADKANRIYLDATINFLRDDNVVVAIWLHRHGFFSTNRIEIDATINFLRDDNVVVVIWVHRYGFFSPLTRIWFGWCATKIRNYFGL